MKTLTQLAAVASFVTLTATGCDVHNVEDAPQMTKQEAQALGGKADGLDFCALFDWYGDGICDPWCPEPDPDCETNECAAIGGSCFSSPIDVTFPANCEADLGMVSSDASCGDIINLACCLPGDPDDTGGDDTGGDDTGGDDTGGDDTGGDEPTACEAAGGQCLSSPIDVTFAADCEGDYGLDTVDADCGGVINKSCCVEPAGEEPVSCGELGGQCLGSPIDVTFGANCEADYGLETLPGTCEFFNRTCCG